MKELVIMVGPPGSGKSTIATGFYGDMVRVSQDDQGKGGHREVFNRALLAGESIVVDRMNFNEQQRRIYTEPARAAGYSINYHIVYIPRQMCELRILQRTGHPTITTREDATNALDFFFRKFEYPVLQSGDSLHETRVDHVNKAMYEDRPAIICDLDGTLCDVEHRRHHVRGDGKKNWPAFFEGLVHDPINHWCADILHSMNQTHSVVYCSGRGSEYRGLTQQWLERQDTPYGYLFMRPAQDHRDDVVVKEMLLDFEILPRVNVAFAIDDRPKVCRMWRRRGITTLQCNDEEF